MSAPLVPRSRPQQPLAESALTLSRYGVVDRFALLGIRGYYRDSMGQPGANDRGIYDDAILLVTPSAYVTFNANTDPSRHRPGIASLVPGRYLYKLGVHGLSKPTAQRYRALVQADQVTVLRDQEGLDKGWFGINIHRGGWNSTSSLGCQTIHPSQWDSFIALVEGEMKREGRKTIPYVLVSNEPGGAA